MDRDLLVPTRARDAPVHRIRLCFLGDSITTGVGDSRWRSWAQRLCAAERAHGSELTPYLLGVRGDTSVEIRRRWRAECRRRLVAPFPGGIVFCFGVNDASDVDHVRRVALPSSLENARAIIGEACAWLPTFWVGPTPVDARREPLSVAFAGHEYRFWNARIVELTHAFREIAAALDVPFLDACAALRDDPDWASSLAAGDGVHPSDHGHRRLADLVARSPAWRAWLAGIDCTEDKLPAPRAQHEINKPGRISP